MFPSQEKIMIKRRLQIGFSILSSDFSSLGTELKKYEKIVDFIHMDIMDGNFVPNLTFGPPLIDSLRRRTKLLFEAHLMVANPVAQWKWYAPSCERIIFHIETVKNPLGFIKIIKAKEKGVSLNPSTPVSEVRKLLEYADVALLMAVPPGFAGQKFDERVLRKIDYLRKYINVNKLKCRISVDGGINGTTAARCISSGADIIITSSWFSSGGAAGKVKKLRSL